MDKSTKVQSNCVSKKLFKILFEATSVCLNHLKYDALIVDTEKLLGKNHESAKKELDDNLVKIFRDQKSKLAFIEDISNIPAQAMILFHGYGDEADYAKFRGIILLLSFQIDEFDYEIMKDRKNLAKILTKYVEEKLTQKWSNLMKYDQRTALFTRLTNNVIFLKNEESCAET